MVWITNEDLQGQMILNRENLNLLIQEGIITEIVPLPTKKKMVTCEGCASHVQGHGKEITQIDFTAIYNYLNENRVVTQRIKERFGKKRIVIYDTPNEYIL